MNPLTVVNFIASGILTAGVSAFMIPGAHTRHQCECGRAPARRDKCVLCLAESVIKS